MIGVVEGGGGRDDEDDDDDDESMLFLWCFFVWLGWFGVFDNFEHKLE